METNKSATPEQAVSEIEAALRSMETLASKPAPSRSMRRTGTDGAVSVRGSARSIARTLFWWLVAVTATATVPLLALVRLSVWFYSDFGLWAWPAVMAGALAGAILFVLFALVMIRAATGRFQAPRYLKRIVVGLALVYCGYSALFVSAANVKTETVRSTYTSLHPSLRMALSTWMIVDSELVITDAERTIEDYSRMGLPANEESLHLPTASGYVHAVDLRTMRRPEWRNLLTTVYFKAMGFRALRHTGTADHLHVSLPVAGH